MNVRHVFALLGLTAALQACDKPAEPDRSGAGGEILEGSVSDAMLPLDAVRSQPPLAGPTSTASGRPGARGDGGDPGPRENESGVEPEAEAAPTATAEATPDAAPPTP